MMNARRLRRPRQDERHGQFFCPSDAWTTRTADQRRRAHQQRRAEPRLCPDGRWRHVQRQHRHRHRSREGGEGAVSRAHHLPDLRLRLLRQRHRPEPVVHRPDRHGGITANDCTQVATRSRPWRCPTRGRAPAPRRRRPPTARLAAVPAAFFNDGFESGGGELVGVAPRRQTTGASSPTSRRPVSAAPTAKTFQCCPIIAWP